MTPSVICGATGAHVTSGDTAAGAAPAGCTAEPDDVRHRGAGLGCAGGPTACGRAGDPAHGEATAGAVPATGTRDSRRPLTTPGALAALLGSDGHRGLPTEVSGATGRPTAVDAEALRGRMRGCTRCRHSGGEGSTTTRQASRADRDVVDIDHAGQPSAPWESSVLTREEPAPHSCASRSRPVNQFPIAPDGAHSRFRWNWTAASHPWTGPSSVSSTRNKSPRTSTINPHQEADKP